MTTVVVRGSGGAVFEMDVPTSAHALELYHHKLANGNITIVADPSPAADLPVPVGVPTVAAEPPRRGRPPKVRDLPETPTVEE